MSLCRSCCMLRTSKPPPMSNSIANAICATTSARPNGIRPTRAAPIRLRPCERDHETRHIRADDENAKADRRHQHPQRLSILGAPFGEPAGARHDLNRSLFEVLLELRQLAAGDMLANRIRLDCADLLTGRLE